MVAGRAPNGGGKAVGEGGGGLDDTGGGLLGTAGGEVVTAGGGVVEPPARPSSTGLVSNEWACGRTNTSTQARAAADCVLTGLLVSAQQSEHLLMYKATRQDHNEADLTLGSSNTASPSPALPPTGSLE